MGVKNFIIYGGSKRMEIVRGDTGKAKLTYKFAQIRHRRPEKARQRRADAGKDVLRLPQMGRRPSRRQHLAIRLRRGEEDRQEGDPHHNLPGVPLPVRHPHIEGRLGLRQEEARRPEEAPRRRLRHDVPMQPKRQRKRILELPRNRGLGRGGVLHEAVQIDGQGLVRKEPRARQVRPPEGDEPRFPHPGEGRPNVLAHQFLRKGVEQKPNSLRPHGREIRRGVHGSGWDQADTRQGSLPEAVAA